MWREKEFKVLKFAEKWRYRRGWNLTGWWFWCGTVRALPSVGWTPFPSNSGSCPSLQLRVDRISHKVTKLTHTNPTTDVPENVNRQKIQVKSLDGTVNDPESFKEAFYRLCWVFRSSKIETKNIETSHGYQAAVFSASWRQRATSRLLKSVSTCGKRTDQSVTTMSTLGVPISIEQ